MEPLTPYPKNWGGFDIVGEHKLHALDRVDCDWLTGISAPGEMSLKKGMFRETYIAPAKIDGVFCIGTITPTYDANAPSYIAGSFNGTTFANRGKFPQNVALYTPAIVPIGSGYGSVQSQTINYALVQDAVVVRIYTTYNGHYFKFLFGFYTGLLPSHYNANFIGYTTVPSYCINPISKKWGWLSCNSYLNIQLTVPPPGGHLDDWYGAYLPSFIWSENSVDSSSKEVTNWYLSNTMLGLPPLRMGVPHIHRVAAYNIVACTPCYVTPDSGLGVAVPFISYSLDNGSTWLIADYAAFMANIIDPIPPTNYNLGFDQSATFVAETFSALPRNLTTCWIFCATTKVFTPQAPVFMGILDLTNGTISGVQMLTQPISDGNYRSWMSDEYSNDWYMIMYGDFNTPSYPVVLWRTKDFLSWEELPTPFIGSCLGLMVSLDPKTIEVVHNEGTDYYIYQTKDSGKTWKKRGRVRTATPPDQVTTLGLQRFGVLTILRMNNVPLSPFPSRPWVCDARINAPT